MSWLELTALLGNLGEFVGAMAVVATLIYLAVQVRYAKASLDANTAALEEDRRLALVQTYQTRAQAGVDNMRYMDDLELMEIRRKVVEEGPESLNDTEAFRFGNYSSSQLMRLDAIHFAWERGFIDEDYYNNTFKGLVIFNSESFLFAGSPIWRRSFMRDVEAILREAFPEREHVLGVRLAQDNYQLKTFDVDRDWTVSEASQHWMGTPDARGERGHE